MTSVVRYAEVTNGTGAVLTTTTGLVIDGQNYSDKILKRTLAAIDLGTEAGKTRDASDPTGGCLLVTVKGAKIKGVGAFQAFRPTTITNASFNCVLTSTATPHYFKYGWRISADGYSLYLYDAADNAETRLAADDFIMFSLILGNY